MRTFILVCLVALLVAGGVAFAVGLVAIDTAHPDGQWIVTLTVNTSMIGPHSAGTTPSSHTSPSSSSQDTLDVKGKIAAVSPEKNELVVSESVKNWTFQLAKDGKVFINDLEGKLAELQTGDEAVVTFDRQGPQLLATLVRATRK